MRTDSYRIAEEPLAAVRGYIKENYSDAYLPQKPHFYKNAQKAQDAHEAIRPSSMAFKPQDIKKVYLTPDQFRLYQLIWNRFVASQMNPAIFDQTTIDIAGANWRTGSGAEVSRHHRLHGRQRGEFPGSP